MVAALSIAAPAEATIMVGSVSGTLDNSVLFYTAVDPAGNFGTPGSLNDDTFTVDFTYDTDLLAKIVTQAGSYIAEGGTQFSAPDFFTQVEITINGVTKSIRHGGADDIEIHSDGTYQLVIYQSPGLSTGDHLGISLSNASTALSATAPTTASGTACSGSFRIWDGSTPRSQGGWGSCTFSSAAFVAPPPPASAVPEPSVWALMMGGTALMGRALRNRRRTMPGA
jgi:hypothetical protein